MAAKKSRSGNSLTVNKSTKTNGHPNLNLAEMHAIQNAFTSRQDWIRSILGSDCLKNIEKECGHPDFISIEDYARAFKRGDIAKRIVVVYPEETWATEPSIFETEDDNETEWEKAWENLKEDFQIFSILQRADVLSGIGQYGILLIGLDDGKELKEPVDGIDEMGQVKADSNIERKLIYLRPFSQDALSITKVQTDTKNPRYGLPVEYSIKFSDMTGDYSIASSQISIRTETVHWSRVIHLADGRLDNDVLGTPRMEVVYNRLLDLKKIMGGSAEMFWKGGFPGLALEASPVADGSPLPEIDEEATQEQMQNYQNGLQRYLAFIGMKVNSLAPQVADPKSHIEMQIRMIAIALSVPWRILMGVEVGQLAGEQDMIAWNRRLERRRQVYVNPYILRPLLDRLMAFGILPQLPEDTRPIIKWPDLNSPSDLDKASVSEKQTNAIAKYVQGGCDALIPEFQFLTAIVGLSDELARVCLEDSAASLEDSKFHIEPPTPVIASVAKGKVSAAKKPVKK